MMYGFFNSKAILNGVTIDLPYSVLDSEFCIPDEVEQLGITGIKYYINSMDYDSFSILYYLFKHDSESVNKCNEIMSIKNEEIIFYPYKDGAPIQTSEGIDIPFYVSDIEPSYLNNLNKYDLLKITLKPTLPIFRSRDHGYGMDWGYWS